MKKSVFLLIFFTLSNINFCQQVSIGRIPEFSLPEHVSGDFSVSASAGILFNTPNKIQPAAGLKLSVFIGKHFSFDSDVIFGRDYIHAGPGIIGIPLWALVLGSGDPFEFDTFSDLIAFVALGVMSLEHITGHIPVKNSFEISPYFSLLRYRSVYEYGVYSETNRINEQLTGTVGLELNKYYKRLLLSPYIETVMGYSDKRFQLNTGISCGLFFTRKRQ